MEYSSVVSARIPGRMEELVWHGEEGFKGALEKKALNGGTTDEFLGTCSVVDGAIPLMHMTGEAPANFV